MDEGLKRQFIVHLVGNGKKPSTANTYANKIIVFQKKNHDLNNITHEDIIKYLAYMKLEAYKSQNERRLMQTALIQFYEWYAPIAGIPNPAVNLEAIKKYHTDPKLIHPDEFLRLLYWTAQKDGERGIRDAAWIALMGDTGIRPEECEQLKYGDIRLRDDCFEITIPAMKSTHSRTFQFARLLDNKIGEYFARYYLWLVTEKKPRANQPLFFQLEFRHIYSEDMNTPLKRGGMRYILNRAAYNAGIDRTISIYMMRHFMATYAILEGGMDLIDLQYVMGHSSVDTTMQYVHIAARLSGRIATHLPTKNMKAQPWMNGYAALLRKTTKKKKID